MVKAHGGEKQRKIMTEEEVQKNMEGWKKQASQLIDFEGSNPAKFMRNSEWLSKLNLKDLIELMSKTTVQQMLERDLFQRKLTGFNFSQDHHIVVNYQRKRITNPTTKKIQSGPLPYGMSGGGLWQLEKNNDGEWEAYLVGVMFEYFIKILTKLKLLLKHDSYSY